MIHINISSEFYVPVKIGFDAGKKDWEIKNSHPFKRAKNPYCADDGLHDYWEKGYLAALHGIDIEW